MSLSEAEGRGLLDAARAGAPLRELLGGRAAEFLAWIQHDPRLGGLAAEVWAEQRSAGACARPREAALAVLQGLLELEAEERAWQASRSAQSDPSAEVRPS